MGKDKISSFFIDLRKVFKITFPILLGYIPLGFGFGFLASQNGISVLVSTLMSVFMYAGAGQYMAVGLLAANATISSIIITEFLLNLRHIVYGLSLISEFSGAKKCKPYLIFALTDETYSVLSTTEVPQNMNKTFFYFGVSFLNQIYWVTGSVAGAVLGKNLQNKTNISFGGIDFALTALFAVLFIERFRKTDKKTFETGGLENQLENQSLQEEKKISKLSKLSDDSFASLIGVLCCVFAVILWRFGIIKNSSNILLLSMTLGFAIILIVKRKSR